MKKDIKKGNIAIAEYMGYEAEKLCTGKYYGRIVYAVKRRGSGVHVEYDYKGGTTVTEFYFPSELEYHKNLKWILPAMDKAGIVMATRSPIVMFRKLAKHIENLK